MYIGEVGKKIEVAVTLVGCYEYTDYSFNYYGTTKYIYTMKDVDGNVLVWKTSSFMSVKTEEKNDYGDPLYYPIKKGDKILIKGTVKSHSVYRDEEQTVLQRVKVQLIERARAVTFEEIVKQKQDDQLSTLKGEDFVWVMPYRQYKEHYSDCETLYHSYCQRNLDPEIRYNTPTIAVIIREGRLKNSGVRGEHYSGYQMENDLGQKITYRAVKEENALKRVKKDFPEYDWKCVKVFAY